MEKSYRMRSMPSAQAHVIFRTFGGDYQVLMVSYNTVVLSIENNKLYCSGVYSPSTSKHINKFTTEFFGENLYYPCKDAWKNNSEVMVDGENVTIDDEHIVKMWKEYEKYARKYYGKY